MPVLSKSALHEVIDDLPGKPFLLRDQESNPPVRKWLDVGLDACPPLRRGTVTIIAARPSMGVTNLVTQIALHVAEKLELPSCLFDLDHSFNQTVLRIMGQQLRLEPYRIAAGNLERHEWERLQAISSHLPTIPLSIEDQPGLTVKRLRTKVEEGLSGWPYGAVVIDSLQLLSPIYFSPNDHRAYAKVIKGLRELATIYDVPVLVTSTLSPRLEKRRDRRPRRSDLPSPAITHADLVMSLYRERYYFPDLEGSKDVAELSVLMSRIPQCAWKGNRMVFMGAYGSYFNDSPPDTPL